MGRYRLESNRTDHCALTDGNCRGNRREGYELASSAAARCRQGHGASLSAHRKRPTSVQGNSKHRLMNPGSWSVPMSKGSDRGVLMLRRTGLVAFAERPASKESACTTCATTWQRIWVQPVRHWRPSAHTLDIGTRPRCSTCTSTPCRLRIIKLQICGSLLFERQAFGGFLTAFPG